MTKKYSNDDFRRAGHKIGGRAGMSIYQAAAMLETFKKTYPEFGIIRDPPTVLKTRNPPRRQLTSLASLAVILPKLPTHLKIGDTISGFGLDYGAEPGLLYFDETDPLNIDAMAPRRFWHGVSRGKQ